MRGEIIKTYDDYAAKWPDRLKKEHPVKMPQLQLVVPDSATLIPSMEVWRARKEHDRLATGEAQPHWINHNTKLLVTNKSKHDNVVPPCPTLCQNVHLRLPSESNLADVELAQNLFLYMSSFI